MKYKVKRHFVYGKIRYRVGDFWVPKGGKWDESIKKHFVYPVEDDSPPKKKRGRPPKKDAK